MASRATFSQQPVLALPRMPALAADAMLMLLIAFALRCWWFGDPVIQTDEQFYLLVGDRMLHGAVPFVDIWDRKPVGLFLVYAAIRSLGGGGILQYQLVATLSAAGAALLVVRIARLHASAAGARLAGAAALLWFIVYDGAGGQAPIFYEPLVAGAALATFRVMLDDHPSARRLLERGLAAMLLLGLAIQIKYTAMFEGIGFGLMLLWRGRRAGLGTFRLAGAAALWVAAALAPTALAFAIYAHAGWGEAFAYANFRSIWERPPTSPVKLVARLAATLALAFPLLAAAAAAWRRPAERPDVVRTRRLIASWLAAALVGFVSVGALYQHYFLPVLLPLAALGAPAFQAVSRRSVAPVRWRPALALFTIGALIACGMSIHRLRSRGNGAEVAALVAAIRPRLADRLYVFDGDPVLYYLTGSPLPTPFAFPHHLSHRIYATSLNIDPAAEVRRIMAERPSVVVSLARQDRSGDPATWAVMRAALARDYRPVAAVSGHNRTHIVYARLHPSGSA